MIVSHTLSITVGIYLDSQRVSRDVHKDVLAAIEQLKLDEFPDLEKGTIKLSNLQPKQRRLILGLGAYIVGTGVSDQKKLTAACDLINMIRSGGDFETLRLTLGYQ